MRFKEQYNFKKADQVLFGFINSFFRDCTKKGEFRLVCCIINHSLPQLKVKVFIPKLVLQLYSGTII